METYFRNERGSLTVVENELISAEQLQEIYNFDEGEINVLDDNALFTFVESKGEYVKFEREDIVPLELETIAEYDDTDNFSKNYLCKDSAGNLYIMKDSHLSNQHFKTVEKTSLKEILRDYEYFTDDAVTTI